MSFPPEMLVGGGRCLSLSRVREKKMSCTRCTWGNLKKAHALSESLSLSVNSSARSVPRALASMSTRLFLLTPAIPGLVPGFPTVPASGRPPGNEVPAIERLARPVPGLTTALALQIGLRGLIFFDNRCCRFLGCHSLGFSLLRRYNCVGKRFSHLFRHFVLNPSSTDLRQASFSSNPSSWHDGLASFFFLSQSSYSFDPLGWHDGLASVVFSSQSSYSSDLLDLHAGFASVVALSQASYSSNPSGWHCGVSSRQASYSSDPSGWHAGLASIVALSQASYSSDTSGWHAGFASKKTKHLYQAEVSGGGQRCGLGLRNRHRVDFLGRTAGPQDPR